MLLHFIKLHWRTVLAVAAVAVVLWACLPAALKAKLSGGWNRFWHAVGNFNARVLLTLVYSIVILPFGLVVRVFADSMHMKKRPEKWFDHPPIPNTLEEARRQG
jgi:ABC-type sulfate transport system permease subunit